jgi:hypothetical protein
VVLFFSRKKGAFGSSVTWKKVDLKATVDNTLEKGALPMLNLFKRNLKLLDGQDTSVSIKIVLAMATEKNSI